MIRNLGKVATILVEQECSAAFRQADLAIMHAPGGCYRDVAKAEVRREREARRHAEAVAQRPFRIIAKELRRRGLPMGSPRWRAACDRFYAQNFPF